MSPTATQPVLMTLVRGEGRPDTIELPRRERDLKAQRAAARTAARDPEIQADIREHVTQLAARLARQSKDQARLLAEFAQAMYVHGRVDQAADDTLAREQTDRLAQAVITQTLGLLQDAS